MSTGKESLSLASNSGPVLLLGLGSKMASSQYLLLLARWTADQTAYKTLCELLDCQLQGPGWQNTHICFKYSDANTYNVYILEGNKKYKFTSSSIHFRLMTIICSKNKWIVIKTHFLVYVLLLPLLCLMVK